MFPTVPFSVLAGVLLGLVFAWGARHQFRDGRQPWGRELWAVGSYQAILRWPVLIYFFLAHREWTFMAVWPAARLSPWLLLLLLPLDAAALLGGYLGGWWLVRRRPEIVLQAAIAVTAGVLLGFVVATWRRLLHEGAVAEVARGVAPTIVETRLIWVLAVVTGGALVGALEVFRTLRTESRRKGRADLPVNRRKPAAP